jgi:hypothetical protein
MNRSSITKLTLFCTICLAILASGQVFAQTTVETSFQWTAPANGSPVDHYVVQHTTDGGATWTTVGNATTNNITLELRVGFSHQVRVAGVDATDRQGVWSEPSDPYTPDLGAPGQPGKPILF